MNCRHHWRIETPTAATCRGVCKRCGAEIDPDDCERIKHLLEAPKKTHTSAPTDMGDYERRYGLRRRRVNGKVLRVPA